MLLRQISFDASSKVGRILQGSWLANVRPESLALLHLYISRKLESPGLQCLKIEKGSFSQ